MTSEEAVQAIIRKSKWYLNDMGAMQEQWKQDLIDLQKGFQERWREEGRQIMFKPVVEYVDCIDGEHRITESSWMSDEDVKIGDTVVVFGRDKLRVLSHKAVVKDVMTHPINQTGNMFHSYITYPQSWPDRAYAEKE